MRIRKLSENTIKVILTKEDFIRRNIDVDKLHPGSQIYRQLVLEVMAQASGEFNFDTNDCRLIVEGQMNIKNELTLLITKSPANATPAKTEKLPANDVLENLPSPEEMAKMLEEALSGIPLDHSDATKEIKSKPTPVFPTEIVIRFKDFDKLISLLHTMPSAKSIASALYMYEDAYYLVLKVYERNLSLAVTFRNQASEFDGEQLAPEFVIPTLLEQGIVIIKRGAIPLLLKKFKD